VEVTLRANPETTLEATPGAYAEAYADACMEVVVVFAATKAAETRLEAHVEETRAATMLAAVETHASFARMT
jgi:hypothetical protein